MSAPSSPTMAGAQSTPNKKSKKLNANTVNPLSVEGNLSNNWVNWIQEFKIYLRASGMENETNSRKVAIFLHYIGSSGLSIFNSFNLDMDTCDYADVVQKFEAHCQPKRNLTVERHNFLTRNQKKDETIDDYLTVLKNLSFKCELDTLRESLVRDVFVLGLLPENRIIKEKLLQEENPPLEKCINIAKSIEITQKQVQQLQTSQEPVIYGVTRQNVNKNKSHGHETRNVNSQQSNSQQSNNQRQHQSQKVNNNKCSRCDQIHRIKCPALNATCNKCQLIGHFAKCCRTKSVKVVNEKEKMDNEYFTIRAINNKTNQNLFCSRWSVDLKINEKVVQCILDSGAEANIMSEQTYVSLKIPNKNLKPANVRLMSFSDHKVPVKGKVQINGKINGRIVNIEFLISTNICDTVLGLPTCQELQLIKKICSLQHENIIQKYEASFRGLGCIPMECHITINKKVQPIINAPRKIPFALNQRLKNELDRMIKDEVIIKVEEPSEWVNSIVITEKKNKSIRVCLDPRNLNKAIKRSHYPFPSMESIRSKLTGAKYFSTLDAQSGFWQIKLDEPSSNLCVFSSPYGRFKFLRMPFGLSCAPEIYHRTMTEIFSGIDGILLYMDDILIYAKSVEEHDEILTKVLEKSKEVNLKFNRDKCHFLLNEIKYLGHVFNADGMRPDQSKISAINELANPTTVTELKRFLGMVNYLGSYINNLADKTYQLRQLLKKNNSFVWDQPQQSEFNNLKRIIAEGPVLTYFDETKTLTLSVDSSKFAVGAVILQQNKPIAYASQSLNETQKRYAQIEKELYAIQYGCTKFREYIYGRTVKVETDHQPLVTLFKKPLAEVPGRLQRMMLNLQQYDLEVNYTPGKYLYIADTLSRSPVEAAEQNNEMEEELRIHATAVINNLAVSPRKLEEIKLSMKNDNVLMEVIKYCLEGWPNSGKEVNDDVKKYFKLRHELHSIEGLLFKGSLLVIPEVKRAEILNIIHEGHLGMEKCLKQARSVVYWPNISKQIKELIGNCTACLKYRRANSSETLMCHTPPDLPWEKVAVDFCTYEKNTYIVVIDYFSNYFEIRSVNSTNATTIIPILKSIFARFGIPLKLMSDNGPPFNSKEFENFTESWDIEHITSSPNYAQSNGLVEKMVGIVKNIFKKCKEDSSDPYVGLLQYRNTPLASGFSPAQLLMSRNLRTKLPNTKEALKPEVINYDVQRKWVEKKNKKMEFAKRNCHDLPKISVGDQILFKKLPNLPWEPATVISKAEYPRSFNVSTPEGVNYRRNRKHLIKPHAVKLELPEEISPRSPRDENVMVPEAIENSTPIFPVDSNDGIRRSRYGREIRRPRRLYE